MHLGQNKGEAKKPKLSKKKPRKFIIFAKTGEIYNFFEIEGNMQFASLA